MGKNDIENRLGTRINVEMEETSCNWKWGDFAFCWCVFLFFFLFMILPPILIMSTKEVEYIGPPLDIFKTKGFVIFLALTVLVCLVLCLNSSRQRRKQMKTVLLEDGVLRASDPLRPILQ